jgi:hypothetical protein
MSTFKDKPLKKCHTDRRQMIDDIHQDKIKYMDESHLVSYYLDNGLLLDQYYRDTESAPSSNHLENERGILSFFKTHAVVPETGDTLNRKQVVNEYLANVDDTVLHDKWFSYNFDKCPQSSCNGVFVLSNIDSTLQCTTCGYTENVIIDCEKGSYNEPPKESNYFAYKRINHFNEWLAQFQAKDISDIPEQVYLEVHQELKKNIYLEWSTITYKQIRDILKNLHYNKYYDNIPHLVNVLSGRTPPKLDRSVEETLRSLFKDIQIPFQNHCPPTRKNFLSYAYVLHKFSELLGYDDLLIYFPLLKSREKLQQQDMIWEKMCQELEWEFIPST